jgi:mono/diheme cytochrome c family protein
MISGDDMLNTHSDRRFFRALHSRGVLAMVLAACMLVATSVIAQVPSASAVALADAKATEPPVSNSVVASATPATDASHSQSALYTVRDGNKVDAKTLAGWKTWRALACERCHGAAQEGLVGPALVESLKTLTKDEFHTTIMNGRLEKGMPPFSSSKMVTENWEGLYAYLKGRSDGQIQPGRLTALDKG